MSKFNDIEWWKRNIQRNDWVQLRTMIEVNGTRFPIIDFDHFKYTQNSQIYGDSSRIDTDRPYDVVIIGREITDYEQDRYGHMQRSTSYLYMRFVKEVLEIRRDSAKVRLIE